jgi:hydrophobic/amphiphilic exporter-1 (mainly G- bacteria), HAE1 family
MGFTLNSMTMLALTLAVGIVIDDAIVVLENIYRFIEEKGMPPMQAAVEATREIGLAVMATTLSLVAIFVPVAFMGGIVGRFMKSFGLTMAFAMIVSLLVSFTLTPMMAARWLKVKPRQGMAIVVCATRSIRVFRPIDRGYTRLLEWSMAHRGWWRWRPCWCSSRACRSSDGEQELHAAGRHVRVRDRPARPRGHQPRGDRRLANRVAAAVRRIPEVDYTMVTVAGDEAPARGTWRRLREAAAARCAERDQFAVIERGARARSCRDTRRPVRTVGAPTGGIGGGRRRRRRRRHPVRDAGPRPRPSCSESERLAGGGTRADSRAGGRGHQPERRQAGAVRAHRSAQGGRPRRAGLRRAEALRLLVGGDQVTTYNEGGEQYEVHVRATRATARPRRPSAQLTVPSSRLGSVTLNNLARFDAGVGASEINRLNRQRQVTVGAGSAARARRRPGRTQMLRGRRELASARSTASASPAGRASSTARPRTS